MKWTRKIVLCHLYGSGEQFQVPLESILCFAWSYVIYYCWSVNYSCETLKKFENSFFVINYIHGTHFDTHRLEVFEQVFEAPRMYVLAVLEILRRKSFSVQFLEVSCIDRKAIIL